MDIRYVVVRSDGASYDLARRGPFAEWGKNKKPLYDLQAFRKSRSRHLTIATHPHRVTPGIDSFGTGRFPAVIPRYPIPARFLSRLRISYLRSKRH
jgi:hypothetical protein